MTGIIILAAGSSSRLGKPKQNLIYKGKTLLQRAIATAFASACRRVMVVLGANAELIEPTIKSTSAQIIYNVDWQEGMASSIGLGIAALQQIDPKIDSVILMLCDQPFVDSTLLNQFILAKSKKGIIASTYNDALGAPVLFDKEYFDELILLRGQDGAKKILSKHQDDIFAIPFSAGSIDIDTLEDYERIIKP